MTKQTLSAEPSALVLPPVACVILAAGQGTRMRSNLPKVLHPVAGRPMLGAVIDACEKIDAASITVVIAPDAEPVARAAAPHTCVVQSEPLGTGHALLAAKSALAGVKGDLLVCYGDTPLVTAETFLRLRRRRAQTGASIVVSGFRPEIPGGYGRLVLDEAGHLQEIVEAKDATAAQKEIGLCNGGIMLFDAEKVWPLLAALEPNNAKGEYYLTDCVALARGQGLLTVVEEIEAEDVFGVNTRVELALAEAIAQRRLREKAMLAGVTMTAPETVFLCWDTELGRDVTLAPHVVFGPGVKVAGEVEIRAFCHLEGVQIDKGAKIGPFARLRPGAEIGPDVHIGNFVEIKNSQIEPGAKVNHLTYIGDARVGARANIGAGTITCNYDGFFKHKTDIGADAFIGSNTALVAPVKVGDGAIIGAGSVIAKDVPADALAVARAKPALFEGWAPRFRAAKAAEKAGKK